MYTHLHHLNIITGYFIVITNSMEFICMYCIESNYLNHPIIQTPPFPGKIINYCIPSIRTPTFEINPNTYTFGSLCGAPMEVAKRIIERLVAFNSLWTSLVTCIVTTCSNVYSVCLCVLCYYRSTFQTIPLIVRTPPFSGKNRYLMYSIEFER